MELVALLEKDDLRKYQILNYLDRVPNQPVKNSKIQEELDFSYYLFRSFVDQIAEDITNFGLETFFNLKVTDSEIVLYELQNINTTVFLGHYLQQATQATLLVDMLKKDSLSLNEFAERNFISYAFAYKRYTSLQKQLPKWGLQLSKKELLLGDELTIRVLLTKLYLMRQEYQPEDFPQIIDNAHQILAVLAKHMASMPASFEIELRNFILISLQRGSQGHLLAATTESQQRLYQQRLRTYADLVEELAQLLPDSLTQLSASEKELEIVSWLSFCMAAQLLPVPFSDYPEDCRVATDNLIAVFKQDCRLQLTDELTDRLRQRLVTLFADVFHLPYRSSFFEDHLEVDFFARSYPEYFQFCEKYFAQLPLPQSPLESLQRHFLFYFSLIAIVSLVPLRLVATPIEVCIDFSLGGDYNHIIARDLRYFSTLHVHVVNQQTPKTRLVITDLIPAYQDTDAVKVIWLTPPRPEDWENLVDQLIEIRQNLTEPPVS